MSDIYTIKDVLKVGNPLDDGTNFKCIKCDKKGEMTYQALPFELSVYSFNYRCGWCGEWQIEEET